MLLANFNLAITCAPHVIPLCTIMHVITHAPACMFGGINFGDLATICQIKIPTKVSGYKVLRRVEQVIIVF